MQKCNFSLESKEAKFEEEKNDFEAVMLFKIVVGDVAFSRNIDYFGKSKLHSLFKSYGLFLLNICYIFNEKKLQFTMSSFWTAV